MTFFELEKECKKRKIRKWLIIGFLVFLLIVTAYVVIKFLQPQKKTEPIKKTPEKIVKKEKNKTKSSEIKKAVKKEILKPVIDLNFTEEKKEKKINKKTNKKIKRNKTEAKSVLILKTSSLPSFDTCILLAEKYYKNKDYENALKWAKNANIQNKTNPKSWIIVAESLYKLGKKDEAIKILKLYYKYTKNKEALELIKRMENDKNF